MRYFLIGYLLLVAAVLGVAGFRGDLTRRPAIELFNDMVRQPKVRPQSYNRFLPEGRGSLVPPVGTIARGQPYEDIPVNTGRETGKTNFVAVIPVPVTQELMARGQERFTINCSPCHGAQADGNGITRRLGAMGVVANLHDKRIVSLADGEIFNTISQGKTLMSGYAAQITVADRWAVIAYLRALQLSRLATLDEVPAEVRSTLTP